MIFGGLGVEDAGVGTLIAVLVALFGIGVKFFTQAAVTSTERFESEIKRLRTDKNEQIAALRAEIESLRAQLARATNKDGGP